MHPPDDTLPAVRELRIARNDAGQRLDRFLRKALPGSGLGGLYKALRKGLVRVNGKKASPEDRLAEGDVVELRFDSGSGSVPVRPAGKPSAPVKLPPVRVLFRDAHVLAVDKPPHVLVQPGEGAAPGRDGTLDAAVLALVGRGDAVTFKPGLAHRIDRGTSGIVLFGLSAEGLRGLTEAFRNRRVEKRYLALVAGSPEKDEFSVDLPLARDPSDDSRGKRVKVSRGGDAQTAVTDFRVLARSADGEFALVEARPRTGRTHQIRAHLRAAGLPILGDPTYGDPRREPAWRRRTGLRRQFLHAWKIRLDHPVGGSPIDVESPLPPDLARAAAACGVSAAV